MKRKRKQGCGQRAREAGKGSRYHPFIRSFIHSFIGHLIMETVFSMDQICCDYNFSRFSGVLLGLQLVPPSLRRQIWERINSLSSLPGWEYPATEVAVLKESIFNIMPNKFHREWPPECKMFLLSVGFQRHWQKTDGRKKFSVYRGKAWWRFSGSSSCSWFTFLPFLDIGGKTD